MEAKHFTQLVPEDKKHLLPSLSKIFEDYLQGKLQVTEWKDHIFPPLFDAETVKYINEEWDDIKENDVYTISYPKTGECKQILLLFIVHAYKYRMLWCDCGRLLPRLFLFVTTEFCCLCFVFYRYCMDKRDN